MNRIFIHVTDSHKKAQIQKVCRNLGIRTTELSYKDLTRTVAEVTGTRMPGAPFAQKMLQENSVPAKARVPMTYSMPDFLLFDRLEEERLDRFLEEYGKANIAPTPYKAVVTPVNLSWSLYVLIEAIREEHGQVSKNSGK